MTKSKLFVFLGAVATLFTAPGVAHAQMDLGPKVPCLSVSKPCSRTEKLFVVNQKSSRGHVRFVANHGKFPAGRLSEPL
jgi:hypothetical protein